MKLYTSLFFVFLLSVVTASATQADNLGSGDDILWMTDDFNKANGALDVPWVVSTGTVQVTSNKMESANDAVRSMAKLNTLFNVSNNLTIVFDGSVSAASSHALAFCSNNMTAVHGDTFATGDCLAMKMRNGGNGIVNTTDETDIFLVADMGLTTDTFTVFLNLTHIIVWQSGTEKGRVVHGKETFAAGVFLGFPYRSDTASCCTNDNFFLNQSGAPPPPGNVRPNITDLNLTSGNDFGDSVSPYGTNDTTPTFTLNTQVDSKCRMSLLDENYDAMGVSRDFSGGEGTKNHTGTLISADALSVGNGSSVFASCVNIADETNQTAVSTSGTITVDVFAWPQVNVSITPRPAFNGNTLSASGNYSHLNGFGEGTSSCRWFVNDVVVHNCVSTDVSAVQTLLPSNFTTGDTIIYEYDAQDFRTVHNISNSSEITIQSGIPLFTDVANNASNTVFGRDVNWSTTITSGGGLSFCWFTHNDSGTFVNETTFLCNTPQIFNQTVTLTASIFSQVCGFFGANSTGNEHNQTVLSCMTINSSIPQFTTVVNNATVNTTIGGSVNWSVTINSTLELDTCWFTHNDSGTFVNETVKLCSNQEQFSQDITITSSVLSRVCGFFGANSTQNEHNQTVQTCFVVADINFPQFSAASNNATVGVLNDVVQFRINITDDLGISTWTFGFNASGSFVNDSTISISGTTAINISVNKTSRVSDTNVCGRFYFNDSFGNQNQSESCYTDGSGNLSTITFNNFNYSVSSTARGVGANTTHTCTLNDASNVNCYNRTGTNILSFGLIPAGVERDFDMNTSHFFAGYTGFLSSFREAGTLITNFTTPVDTGGTGFNGSHFLYSFESAETFFVLYDEAGNNIRNSTSWASSVSTSRGVGWDSSRDEWMMVDSTTEKVLFFDTKLNFTGRSFDISTVGATGFEDITHVTVQGQERYFMQGIVGGTSRVWEFTRPLPINFTTVINNATTNSTTGRDVNWTTTIESSTELSFCWFTHNDSGSFVNETVRACTTPEVFNQTITLTASPLSRVCGFFGGNNTINEQDQSAQSCFTVADINSPQALFTGSNSSTSFIDDVVQFRFNLSDVESLGSWTVGNNITGSFVNTTTIFFENSETAANITFNLTVTVANTNYCVRMYVNDTFGNPAENESCQTTLDFAELNVTLFDRRNATKINDFNVSINSTNTFAKNVLNGILVMNVSKGAYTFNINSTGFGRTEFPRIIDGPLNLSVNMPNFFIRDVPTASLETAIQRFSLGINRSDDSQYTNVLLNYNGTTHTTTRTVTATTVWYNKSLNIPAIFAAQQNVEFKWNYTINGSQRLSELFNLSVLRVQLLDCTDFPDANLGNVSVNISVFNEENTTKLLTSDVDVSFSLFVSDRVGATNTSFSLGGSSSYAFCLNPNNSTINADAFFSYTTLGGFTHRFYLINESLTNTTQFLKAYNYNTSDAISDLKGTIRVKENFSFFSGTVAQMQRNYVGEGIWRTVQMDKSGDFGLVFFNIREENTNYRFIFLDGLTGEVLKTTDSLKFVCDPITTVCEVVFIVSPRGDAALLPDLGTTFSFNNVTNILTIAWNDPTEVVTSVTIKVTKETLRGTDVICDISVAGSSGLTTCDVSGKTGPFTLSVTSTASPEIFNLRTQFGHVQSSIQDFVGGPKVAAFFTGIIVILMGSIAAAAGVAAGVAVIIGALFVASILGFVTFLDQSVILVLAIVTVFIAHLAWRRVV